MILAGAGDETNTRLNRVTQVRRLDLVTRKMVDEHWLKAHRFQLVVKEEPRRRGETTLPGASTDSADADLD